MHNFIAIVTPVEHNSSQPCSDPSTSDLPAQKNNSDKLIAKLQKKVKRLKTQNIELQSKVTKYKAQYENLMTSLDFLLSNLSY